MPILATDIIVKTAIEAAIAHLRQNSWLWDDIWGGLATDSLSKAEYGWKEVDRAKNWFKANDIKVYTAFRVDLPDLPAITIVNESTSEALDRTSLGDTYEETGDFDPSANSLIQQMIYSPFTPKSYNPTTGTVTFPDGTITDMIVPGQFLVSSKTSKAYQILSVGGPNSFTIKANTVEDFMGAYIAPPTSLWNVKREITYFNESFNVGVHANSDPIQCIWMRQLVLYILLRYKEAYIERRGLELTTPRAGAIDLNAHFPKEKVFSCFINMHGIVPATWIKYVAPKLQSVVSKIYIADGPKTPNAYINQVRKQGWQMAADKVPEKEVDLADILGSSTDEDGVDSDNGEDGNP
jgi:hypothetical protein